MKHQKIPMQSIVLATGNAHKFAEMQAILSPIECVAQHTMGIESPDETGASFIENAILKARHASRLSNRPALADDSGLVVPALRGAPGIYSARYSGAGATDSENIDKLLFELKETVDAHRNAFFYCAIAYLEHADSPTPIIATGILEGVITRERAGTNGFGYDPIFFLPTNECTLANLNPTLKNELSHRAKALYSAREQLGA